MNFYIAGHECRNEVFNERDDAILLQFMKLSHKLRDSNYEEASYKDFAELPSSNDDFDLQYSNIEEMMKVRGCTVVKARLAFLESLRENLVKAVY